MKKAIAIAGLFYGDEGKGTMTDYLVRHNSASLVVRYNGGSQAAHNVVTDDGKHHTFAQIGSGAFAGAKTYLSHHMLVDPIALDDEEGAYGNEMSGMAPEITISPGAVVITPFHRYLNQFRELMRGGDAHGSCGNGVGETRRMALEGKCIRWRDLLLPNLKDMLFEMKNIIIKEMSDLLAAHVGRVPADDYSPVRKMGLFDPAALADHLRSIARGYKQATFKEIAAQHDVIVFEGAQGVMLDETHGWAPYNTWTDCTFNNFFKLMDEAGAEGVEVERVAVMRSYLTRHGAGPFLTENPDLVGWEKHNKTHPFMGPMRFGYFDYNLAKTALRILGGVESLAVTHLDELISDQVSVGYSFKPEECAGLERTAGYLKNKPIYRPWHRTPELVCQDIERELRRPVVYRSYGPAAKDKEYHARAAARPADTHVPA